MYTFYVIKWKNEKNSFIGSCTYSAYTEAKETAEELKDDYDEYEILCFTTD